MSPPSRPTPAPPRSDALMAWYDRHHRHLPWRAPLGKQGDPYHVFLSEIMLQQTTVKAVAPYFMAFLQRWPDISSLAAAPLEDVLSAWAGLGYYARARNLHACARAVVERHDGTFPDEEATLRTLPGIGPYTAAAIAAIAFNRPTAPVDGNIERVISRLFRITTVLPKAKPDIRRHAEAMSPADRPGDFAQAMMDLGATICTPKSPACTLCPWFDPCAARAAGDPTHFPVKPPKAKKPSRAGVAFVAIRADGAVLMRTRPHKGLLAGMTEVPSTPWGAAPEWPQDHAPLRATWQLLPTQVEHVFTHFALTLKIMRADLEDDTPAPPGHRWVTPAGFDAEALPSLMRKVLMLALDET